MSDRSVYCIATTRQQADYIVGHLQATGFSNEAISALFSDPTHSQGFAHEKHTKAPEGAMAGAGTGGVLGGALGWIAGIGALAVPGVGPLIAAGPIVAALTGAAIGAAVGGIAGGLIGLGIPEQDAKQYEARVKEGDILISVHTGNDIEVQRAKGVFEAAGAHDVRVYGGSSTDAAKQDPAEFLRQAPFATYTETAQTGPEARQEAALREAGI